MECVCVYYMLCLLHMCVVYALEWWYPCVLVESGIWHLLSISILPLSAKVSYWTRSSSFWLCGLASWAPGIIRFLTPHVGAIIMINCFLVLYMCDRDLNSHFLAYQASTLTHSPILTANLLFWYIDIQRDRFPVWDKHLWNRTTGASYVSSFQCCTKYWSLPQ